MQMITLYIKEYHGKPKDDVFEILRLEYKIIIPIRLRSFIDSTNGAILALGNSFARSSSIQDESYFSEGFDCMNIIDFSARGDESIISIMESCFERFPPNTIPIVADLSGNYVLVEASEQLGGKTFFWDHESIEAESAFYSFSDFILSLKPPLGSPISEVDEDRKECIRVDLNID